MLGKKNVCDRPFIGRMLTLVNPIVISGARASVGTGVPPSHGRAGGERTEEDSLRPTCSIMQYNVHMVLHDNIRNCTISLHHQNQGS